MWQSNVLLALILRSLWCITTASPPVRQEADESCETEPQRQASLALLQASHGLTAVLTDSQPPDGVVPQISMDQVANGDASKDEVFPPLQTEEEYAYDFPRDDNDKVKAKAPAPLAPKPKQKETTPEPEPTTTVTTPPKEKEMSPEEIAKLKKEIAGAKKQAEKTMTKRDELSDVWQSARTALETDKKALADVQDRVSKVDEKLDQANKTAESAKKELESLTSEEKTLKSTLKNESAAEDQAHVALEYSIADAQGDEQKVVDLEAKLQTAQPAEERENKKSASSRSLLSPAALLCTMLGAITS